jgi:hypothetical protein
LCVRTRSSGNADVSPASSIPAVLRQYAGETPALPGEKTDDSAKLCPVHPALRQGRRHDQNGDCLGRRIFRIVSGSKKSRLTFICDELTKQH